MDTAFVHTFPIFVLRAFLIVVETRRSKRIFSIKFVCSRRCTQKEKKKRGALVGQMRNLLLIVIGDDGSSIFSCHESFTAVYAYHYRRPFTTTAFSQYLMLI